MQWRRFVTYLWNDPRTVYSVQCVGDRAAVNGAKLGTKCAAVHSLTVEPRCHVTVCCRLHRTDIAQSGDVFGKQFDSVFSQRRRECREFYARVSESSAASVAL